MGKVVSRFLVMVIAASLLITAPAIAQPKFTLPDVANPMIVSAPEIGRSGGTFVVTVISDPRTFNFLVAQETSSTVPLGYMFEALVEVNRESTEVEASLAESWTVSRDGRTWLFKLRQGVQWFDGKPVTADDVVFTLDAAFTQGVQSSLPDILTIAGKKIGYRKIDNYTVEFKTDEPFGPFLRSIGFAVMPKHKLEGTLKAGAAEFNRSWGVNTNPRELVGNGPFVMHSYVPGQRILFTRNTKYWRVDKKGNRLPYLTRLVVEIVPNQDAGRLK